MTVSTSLPILSMINAWMLITPKELISKIVPDVLVKGGDYDPDQTDAAHPKYIVGRNTVLKNGGCIHTVDLVDGFSTTSIINKMKL